MNTNNSYVSIYQIANNSIYDGCGTRLVLFFQGCNANCSWCHSPHSKYIKSPLLYNDRLCIKCKRCAHACSENVHSFYNEIHKIDRIKCTLCGKCVLACPLSSNYRDSNVLSIQSKEYVTYDLYKMIAPNLQIIKRDGGITLSGGEALLQLDACKELLEYCRKDNIHTALETSGLLSSSHYKCVEDLVDSWLFGLRIMTDKKGIKNIEHIEKTLDLIQSFNKEILIRYPVIPYYTDTKEHLNSSIKILKKHKIDHLYLSPFNKDTDHYYQLCGENLNIEMPTIEEQDNSFKYVKNYFELNGISCLEISKYKKKGD